jgi:hypothetical protein
MAGYGAMFNILIRWITKKNDELSKIMLWQRPGVERTKPAKCLDEIRDASITANAALIGKP